MPSRRALLIPLIALGAVMAGVVWLNLVPQPRRVGLARVDVTPQTPVRLGGYGGRPGPHTGVAQRLWAKAMALGGRGSAPALWLTLDGGGLARDVWVALRDRIHQRTGVAKERIVLTISHTHSAPATSGWAPFIHPEDMSAEEAAAMDRYTDELLGKLEGVAVEALASMEPAELSWTEGSAGFAANRRTPGGPTDPALPVLVAETRDGRLRAVVVSYACHCTTCGGGLMQVSGDWAGYAQEALERDHPGAQAMVAIGCAGDADPEPRLGDDLGLARARQHGETVAAEVARLLAQPRRPLRAALEARTVAAPLPLAAPFSRDELVQRAREDGVVGRHARHWLAKRESGAAPPTHLEYEITAWNFGDELALAFLPGEVVVDYSLRLKREFDRNRLWVNAYSQWLPCYIPSRRILEEGGYEAETSMWYYNRPGRLDPEAEDILVSAVHLALPPGFAAPAAASAKTARP